MACDFIYVVSLFHVLIRLFGAECLFVSFIQFVDGLLQGGEVPNGVAILRLMLNGEYGMRL